MPNAPALSPSSIPAATVLAALPARRAAEADELVAMMRKVTGCDPVVWAGKILGFGSYRYRYDSGHAGVAPLVGFAPTSRHHAVYLVGGYRDRYPALVAALAAEPGGRGSPRLAHGCLYLTRLGAIDRNVLRTLIERTVRVHRALDAGENDEPAGHASPRRTAIRSC